jgi:hypothetical protein
MKNLLLFTALFLISITSQAQSADSILEGYAKSDDVSKMSLTSDVLRMFAKEYEQREIIDKIDKIEIFIFSEEKRIKKEDLTLIKASLKTDNYEELVNVRDEGTKIQIMIKEKGDTIKRLFMMVDSPDNQSIIAEMKCNLTYDDLRSLELNFDGAPGLEYFNKATGKKM